MNPSQSIVRTLEGIPPGLIRSAFGDIIIKSLIEPLDEKGRMICDTLGAVLQGRNNSMFMDDAHKSYLFCALRRFGLFDRGAFLYW